MLVVFIVLTFLGTFLTAALAVLLGYTLLQRRRQPGAATDTPLFDTGGGDSILKDESLSTISFVDHLLARYDVTDRLQRALVEANLTWSVGRVVMLVLLLGAITMALLMQISWIPLWALLIVCFGASAAPIMFVYRVRKRRFLKFEEQLPEALDSLCSSLRAGHNLAAGISMLGSEYPDPLGPEMRQVFEERKLGLPMEQALENLNKRIPLMDVGMFVAAVQIQLRTGGNLGEALGRLSETMRETAALRGEVQSIAAHGKLTGAVLTALPFAIVAMMFFVNPDYFTPLLVHPHGKDMIFAALAALLLAHLIIQQIIKVEM